MPYHGSNGPADINRTSSVTNVHLWIFHGRRWIVQHFKANIHYIFFELFEKIQAKGYEYLGLLALVQNVGLLRGAEVRVRFLPQTSNFSLTEMVQSLVYETDIVAKMSDIYREWLSSRQALCGSPATDLSQFTLCLIWIPPPCNTSHKSWLCVSHQTTRMSKQLEAVYIWILRTWECICRLPVQSSKARWWYHPTSPGTRSHFHLKCTPAAVPHWEGTQNHLQERNTTWWVIKSVTAH